MKVTVVYDSFTGNTRKAAEAVARAMGGAAIFVKEADGNLLANDAVIAATPNIHGEPTAAIKAFLEEATLPAKVGLLITYGAPLWGPISSWLCRGLVKKILIQRGLRLVVTAICPGYHVKLKTYRGHPDEKDLGRVTRAFAKRLKGI